MRNIYLVQLSISLKYMLFVMAVIILYVTEHKNMSMAEFLTSESIFALSLVIFEVPSGWLSDIWKRKHTLILGSILYTLGIIVMVLSQEFWGWTLGQIITASGIACSSGTDTSLIYDSLLLESKEHEYKKHVGRLSGISLGTAGIATLLGGYLYKINPQLPLMMTILSSSISLIPLLFIQEPERHKEPIHHHPIHDMLMTMKYALKHREIFALLLFSGALFAGTKMGMWLQQPYYMKQGIPEEMFGYFMAGGPIVAFVLAMNTDYFDRKFGFKALSIGMLFFIPFIAFTVSSIWLSPVGAILLMCCSGLYGIGKPLISHELHSRVSSSRRATVQSTAALAPNLIFTLCAPAIGLINDHSNVQYAYMLLSFYMIIFVGAGLWAMHRQKVI